MEKTLRQKKTASRRSDRYDIPYLIGQAFVGLWRNLGMSVASVLVLLACLLVTGSFYALLKNINYNLADLGKLNQIVVYLDEAYTDAETERAAAEIAALPGVEGTAIVTKEEALASEKAKYADKYPHLFATLSEADNPYRDAVTVTYKDGAKVGQLESEILRVAGVKNLTSRAEIGDSVASVKRSVSMLFVGFMAALFVVTLFVIIMTIRLAVLGRSKEITVMRYIGATRAFVMLPFVLEGIIIGMIAAVAAFFLQHSIYNGVAELLMAGGEYALFKFIPFRALGTTYFGGFLLIGVLTGGGGSWISLRRYLKV